MFEPNVEIEYKYYFPKQLTAEKLRSDDYFLRFDRGRWRRIPMHAHYFADKKGLLVSHRLSLRLRQEDERFVLTLKAQKGAADTKSESERYEWNYPLSTSVPDWEAFSRYLIEQKAARSVRRIMGQLRPGDLFSAMETEIVRWVLPVIEEAFRAEISIDEGWLIAGDKREVCREIEIEYKSGDRSAFICFAKAFQQRFALDGNSSHKFSRLLRLKEQTSASTTAILAQEQIYDYVIIGAGASGLYAAAKLVENLPDSRILLLEQLSSMGKKISATGNGRCNLAPAKHLRSKEAYHSFSEGELEYLYNRLPWDEALNQLMRWGLVLRQLGDGLYPYSLRAESLLSLMQNRVQENSALSVCLNCRLVDIDFKSPLLLSLENGEGIIRQIHCRNLLLATGGNAQKVLGSDGSVAKLLKQKGIKTQPIGPALDSFVMNSLPKAIQGSRLRAAIALINPENQTVLACEAGEVLFSRKGLSGIPVMQLSAVYHSFLTGEFVFTYKGMHSSLAREVMGARDGTVWSQELEERLSRWGRHKELVSHKRPYLVLDSLPHLSEQAAVSFWEKQVAAFRGDCELALTQLFPRELALWIKRLSVQFNYPITELLKALPIPIDGTEGFDKAQVTYGGVALEACDLDCLMLKKSPGVYVMGELLDVFGDCGGYNLHLAFATAELVCKHIITEAGKV